MKTMMSSAGVLFASLKRLQIISELLLILSISILFLFSGCKKETLPSFSTSYNYFPVETGTWVEYDVDSIYHSENDNNNDDSVYSYHFMIREEIESSFTDGEGRLTQVIRRYRRENTSEDWTVSDIWTQVLTSTGAYRTENNICYHKLSFPINSRISWNINDQNTLEEEICSYDFFHEPLTFEQLSFDSTISIIQVNEDNFIERYYGNEIYAAGVGLIFKQRDELGKRNGVVVSGLEYKMQITAFGKN